MPPKFVSIGWSGKCPVPSFMKTLISNPVAALTGPGVITPDSEQDYIITTLRWKRIYGFVATQEMTGKMTRYLFMKNIAFF